MNDKNVFIYYINLKKIAAIQEANNRLFPFVSKRILEKVNRYYNEMDKIRTMLGEFLVRYSLINDFGVDSCDSELQRTAAGKPIYHNGEICSSISHKEDFVVCAVSKHEVGIDIELIRNSANLGVVNRFFSNKEKTMMFLCSSQDEQAKLFYQLWTQKEAAYKIDNLLLGSEESNLKYQFYNIDISNRYICSLCCSENRIETHIQELFLDNFLV